MKELEAEEEWVPHERRTWPWSFGRLKRDVAGERYLQRWDKHGPVVEPIPMPTGTLVRIVMVSRFGDVGITPNLDDSHGYVARVGLSDLERER
jgi:hypothetical protein